MPQLPPGFVLEGQPAPPSLPQGFVLEKQEPWSGSILPFSGDEQGNWSFDSNAGIVGIGKSILSAAKGVATLPGDVFTGKTDPMSDEAIGRAADTAMFASPLNPAIRAGDMAIPGVAKMLRRPNVEPPSEEALLKAGGDGLNAIREMGVDYSVPAVQDAVRGIRAELYEKGLREQTAPTTHSLLKDFDADGTIATAADLMAARQAFRQAAKKVDENRKPTPDAVAAMRVIAGLDRFIKDPGMDGVLSGPAEAVSAALKRANANYAAGKRSGTITRPATNAERRAEASNSGFNIDNTIRQRIASLLENPKKLAGFKKSEVDELEAVVSGNRTRNTSRWIGNYLGGGGGLGAMLTTGAGVAVGSGAGFAAGGAIGGPLGAVIPLATGVSAKALGNTLTKRAISNADKTLRKRSPLYEDMQQAMPLEAISPEKRAAIVRALLLADPQVGRRPLEVTIGRPESWDQ